MVGRTKKSDVSHSTHLHRRKLLHSTRHVMLLLDKEAHSENEVLETWRHMGNIESTIKCMNKLVLGKGI